VIQGKFYRIINETFGNFKILKFISNQAKLLKSFHSISSKYSKANILNTTLQLIPRSVLEAFGLSLLMAMVIYTVSYEKNVTDVIPIISMYALALYRVLPAISKIILNYNNIAFYTASLDIVYKDISYKSEREFNNDISFNNEIDIRNISYSHSYKDKTISNLSFKIKKGQKVAFIGRSGSGKTTLVDLICGIYTPNSGEILIDGVKLNNSNILSWREGVGYIPQAIYLFDGSISDNVTFGRPYDKIKLIEALKRANIYDFILTKSGIKTLVGEGGVQLSGGQKQRVGIARALYGVK
jgi:ATP-binding cassette, subfamily B, bacterial PglK